MNENKDIDFIASYYEKRWKAFKLWWRAEETYCIHYGFYDKKTKNFIDAVMKMNDIVGDLLELEKNNHMKILDAGCGIGGTSIYLARKYPKNKFIGITNSQNQVELGKKIIQKNNLSNVEIIMNDFTKTNFTDNSFDGIFSIESAGYAENIEEFIVEMNRILKPNGKLIVLDGFRIKDDFDSFTKKIYETYLYGQGYEKFDLPYLKKYLQILKEKRFENISYNDISKNVAKTQIRGVIIGIPFFISFLIKNIFTLGILNSKKNYLEFSMGVSVIAPIIALKNVSRYYLTTATKKA